MSLDLHNDNPNDRLDRAVHAIRNVPIPDGPSSEVLADTLAALGSAAEMSSTLKLRRFTSMKFITRFAASILLACGLAAILFVSLRSSVALADVVKKVREAKTLSYVTSVSIPGVKDLGQTRFVMDNAGHVRIEQADGAIVTMDSSAGKLLVRQPRMKTATVMTFDPGKPNAAGGALVDPIEQFKKLSDKPSKDLGVKEVDGKKAKGFMVQEDGRKITIWADAASGDPLRMEVALPLMGKQATVTMSKFEFDLPLEASFFSIEPPADYQVVQTKVPNIKQDGERLTVEALREFAKRSNGRFPAQMDAWGEFAKLATRDAENPGRLDAASTQWMNDVGMMTSFVQMLPADEYAYLGRGVTLNQKDTIIFWYRNPETKKYRAIYADLTVKDVEDVKELPKAPADVKVAPRTAVPAVPVK